MERFKEHPISTILGLIFIAFAFVLLFIPTLYDIPLWSVPIIAFAGLLLLYAKDKFIDILTLGFSRFINDAGNKLKK